MAEIKFYANVDAAETSTLINHTTGSGLGFYGSAHGISVALTNTQDTTFVTNQNGTAEGTAVNNTKFTGSQVATPGSVQSNLAPGATYDLTDLPSYAAPLNIRFTHDTQVMTKNPKLRIFDRNNINNHASGVTTYVYDVRNRTGSFGNSNKMLHRSTVWSEDKWFVFEKGYANNSENQALDVKPLEDFYLTESPGVSGLNTNSNDASLNAIAGFSQDGSTHRSLRHDWYLAISAKPTAIGSAEDYALYFSVEYL